MRKLRHHEAKLLKKVNFYDWKFDKNIKENAILQKFHIQDREDYAKYMRLVGRVKKVSAALMRLDKSDEDRIKMTDLLLDKLYDMGLISQRQSLEDVEKVCVSSFCGRRLAVQMVKNKYAEDYKTAIKFCEQGHVRMGPEIVTNPAMHVTRQMGDHIAWAEGSSIKRTVRKFHNEEDDFTLLGN